VAFEKTEEAVAKHLGVDALIYLPLNKLKEAIGVDSLCMACLDGDYPVPVEKKNFLETRSRNIGGGGKNEVNG
jgi:amidophosphoribosyltransferase